MLLSELIAKLQEILDREGDEDVYLDDEDKVTEVRHMDGDSGWDYYCPARTVIR